MMRPALIWQHLWKFPTSCARLFCLQSRNHFWLKTGVEEGVVRKDEAVEVVEGVVVHGVEDVEGYPS